MEGPLVSVVLPTYNGMRYLHESVASVLRQTYTAWELIVVDDGSTDETSFIVSELTRLDRRVRSLRHERNLGLPEALNTGFRAATGEYLTWTSDDNRYLTHALHIMVDYLERHPDVAFVCAARYDIDEHGCRIDRRPRVPGPLWKLPVTNCVGPCFLYRRQVAEKLGPFRRDCQLAEDYEYWLRVQRHFRMAVIREPLYEYRKHERSLTSTYGADTVLRAAELARVAAWAEERSFVRKWLHAQRRVIAGYTLCDWFHRPWLTARKALRPWARLRSAVRLLRRA